MADERRPILQGEYKLLSILEQIGDDTVYKSQSVTHTEQLFAIREVKLEGYDAPEKKAVISAYFQPIAQEYMDFTAPCLTTLRDFFFENGYIYFVFEYMPGMRLSRYMRLRRRPLSENSALSIAYQAARALEIMHTYKPIKFLADFCAGNIILASNGFVAFTDYGLGKLLCEIPANAPRMGTIGYAAPEQYGTDGIVSAATDIYGLGVLMHYLVTGLDPAAATGYTKLASISDFNTAVSDEYMKIVRMATRTDPEKRYPSAKDMAEDILSIAPRRGCSSKEIQSQNSGFKSIIDALKAPFMG